MKRCWGAMNRLALAAIAAALAFTPAQAQRRDKALEAVLLAHVTELASDAYDGREPGTEGEAKTLRYLGQQWFEIGLESGTNDPRNAWFAPVKLVAREPATSNATFSRKGRPQFVPPGSTEVFTSGKRTLVNSAPILFVGKGTAEVGRAELAGRIALLLDGGNETSERQNALLKAGAAGVMTVLDAERTLEQVRARRGRSGYALATEELGGDLEAFITAEGMQRVLAGGPLDFAALKALAERPDFSAKLLELAVTLEATTRETRINTHNVIGRLPGRRPESGAVLLLAHWDHFGECAAAPAEDLICNGAIDNASGLAALTEIARRLAKGPAMDRDVYFLATTAEEIGLLGAEAFADDPPLPLNQIVAAFNLDSFALAPRGAPIGIVGRGLTPLDPGILAVAKAQKRKVIDGNAANAYIRRQDGWALLQHDVPTVMVSSSWSDLARVERFFDTDYHRPGDQVKTGLDLSGTAEDVAFHVALVRHFADLKKVPPRSK
jgi:Zn-dependent M28 family amino/carboxypeptidase